MMIKKYGLLVLMCVMGLVTSCMNDAYDYDTLFPEEYDVVFCIKNSTNVTMELSRSEESAAYTVVVLKGGAYPDMEGDVSIEPWTEEEVAEYAAAYGRDLRLLPADAYSLSESDLHFNPGEKGKDVVVTFDTSIAANYIDANTSGFTYVLPLRLVSSNTIDGEKGEILIEIEMND